jgi:hypothetical protein
MGEAKLFDPNVQELLSKLNPSDLVLDVGGWACPFNRANWVMDAQAYETRGFYRTFGGVPFQGGDKEWFSAATWVRRDICDKTPFPFADKQFDFAICSHTLEDVRDPLWVCSELIRVAKRGYIEVPSREWETCRGLERPGQAGLSHHRWLIDIDGRRIRFLMKYHMIHSHWRFCFPCSHGRRLPRHRRVQWLWWENSFEFEEVMIYGVPDQERELEYFVRSVRPYSSWQYGVDWQARRIGSFAMRIAGRLNRTLVGSVKSG